MEYFTEEKEKEKELKMDILKQFYISKPKKEFNIKQTITSLLDNPQIETFTIKRKENIFLISKIFQHLFDLLILNIQQFSFISLSKNKLSNCLHHYRNIFFQFTQYFSNLTIFQDYFI
ncbi:hypothetical protein M0811_13978 [Anaeramoeba ignava]|uniref:Uncharacterized protein n=1 Tax=Anaeramoeba ignava TaxID=1746090 RepID=A0A9Q0LX41_ANAIG|nr:hypothetical protein M0811_13978 [Anaeramoeba ignava]